MTVLVTGGTGSFGHAFVRLCDNDSLPGAVRVLSRDEEKQRRMAIRYPAVDFVLGDVRDRDAVRRAMRGVTHVFHAAALKQVPPLEANPGEAWRTNILGTENVCVIAQELGAKVVLLSTDKAVEPVGVMGGTKMLAEAITVAHGFNVVRYGNVVGSRGSIVPLFRSQIAKGEPITVTDPTMTRFLITLEEAIGLVELAMAEPPSGTIFARKSPAATVEQIVRVMAPRHPTRIIGVRPGEKRTEHLVASHERAIDCGDHFRINAANDRAGIYYSSDTAPRLTDETLAALIDQAPADDYL
jgi:UDP-N-acetylglucosamine 4,6-dehydratase